MKLKIYKLLFIILFFFVNHVASSKILYAKDFEDSIKKEFGFWLGGTFPAPGTKLDDLLDSTISMGLFLRYLWPSPFLLETGFSYGSHKSLSTQQLLMVPVYFSLCYPISVINRFQFLAKLGLGASFLEIRPYNVNGWDPIVHGGFEFSVLASKRFKVGLRLDGYYIYDRFRNKPEELNYLLLFPGTYNLQVSKTLDYTNYDGAMYNFGLMVSFLF